MERTPSVVIRSSIRGSPSWVFSPVFLDSLSQIMTSSLIPRPFLLPDKTNGRLSLRQLRLDPTFEQSGKHNGCERPLNAGQIFDLLKQTIQILRVFGADLGQYAVFPGDAMAFLDLR